MIELFLDNKTQAAWLPAGLISWYAAGGEPVALVTSWLALVGGPRPRLRTAWHGRQALMAEAWEKGDFVLNVPYASRLDKIRHVMRQGKLCLQAEAGLGFATAAGSAVLAPRLLGCAMLIECSAGKLVDAGYATELCGDVVLVQRGEIVLDPCDPQAVCAILPLSLSPES